MSATNNVVGLGETTAQRLTALEARVPSDDLPDNTDGGRTIEGRITKTIAARAGQPIIHTMSEAPHGDMTRLEVGRR